MTPKEILQKTKAAMYMARVSNKQAGRLMSVSHQTVSAMLLRNDCYLNTLIELLEATGVYDAVMRPEPRKVLADALSTLPARRAAAEKLGKEVRYISCNLTSENMRLSTLIEMATAAGCIENIFK